MFTPWFKLTWRWFPTLLILLILIDGILILEPMVTHSPIDYLHVGINLLIISGILAFLLLYVRSHQNTTTRKEGVALHLGQVNLPEQEALFKEKPHILFRFLGVSLSYTRSGKYWKLTLSTDD